MGEFTIGPCPEQGLTLPSKTSVADAMNRKGLHLVSDLYEALALSHICLLVPKTYNEWLEQFIEQKTVDELYHTMHAKYINKALRMSDIVLLNITNIIRDVLQGTKSRRKARLHLLQLSEGLNENEATLIDIICSCLQKLPNDYVANEIAEMELITMYLDPILGPMFHQPSKARGFRWINQMVGEHGAAPTNLRPDGIATLTPDHTHTFALGFCEVKRKNAEKRPHDTQLDTFRIAMFCKDALDKGEIKCTMGVQAVGMDFVSL
ncbi:hypothetical protein EC973_003998 [Apophysomyces ossiformis]|uniref:Uncharacterized protein n=1 Tax=Apophysomyces ossiformis TaxID=679940 RepID=A0A8H7BXJ4_9FUNG|nr:hypothetical protein EC973_003998 [Apophysomyces ossiformis]